MIGLGFTHCAAAAYNLCENDTFRCPGRKDKDESDGRAGAQKRRVMLKIVCVQEVNSEVLIYR